MSAEFQRLCRVQDVPEKGVRNFNLNGEEVAVFHTPEAYLVRSGVCKHNGFKLELCDLKDDVIQCPLHLWQYRLSTGKGIRPSYTQLDLYEVELREDEIWVRRQQIEEGGEEYDTSGYKW